MTKGCANVFCLAYDISELNLLENKSYSCLKIEPKAHKWHHITCGLNAPIFLLC